MRGMQGIYGILFIHDARRSPLNAGSLGIKSPGHVVSGLFLLRDSVKSFLLRRATFTVTPKVNILNAKWMLDIIDIALPNLRIAPEGVFQ